MQEILQRAFAIRDEEQAILQRFLGIGKQGLVKISRLGWFLYSHFAMVHLQFVIDPIYIVCNIFTLNISSICIISNVLSAGMFECDNSTNNKKSLIT